jgi:hypothetical protein
MKMDGIRWNCIPRDTDTDGSTASAASKYGFYEAAKDASDETRRAVDLLQSSEILRRHGLASFYELSTHEEILSALMNETDGKAQDVAALDVPRLASS